MVHVRKEYVEGTIHPREHDVIHVERNEVEGEFDEHGGHVDAVLGDGPIAYSVAGGVYGEPVKDGYLDGSGEDDLVEYPEGHVTLLLGSALVALLSGY